MGLGTGREWGRGEFRYMSLWERQRGPWKTEVADMDWRWARCCRLIARFGGEGRGGRVGRDGIRMVNDGR